ncbi:flagellar hook-length control protein FliK [Vibrio mexicanus]|uniref:flagellar hook-length control protein FliK n=1 Tax=Vibrio mexicanus TaxID=1004326 RepID=UPI00063C835A|nr:flagellar hook-length control protein FliK [Vibrio mexicanus]
MSVIGTLPHLPSSNGQPGHVDSQHSAISFEELLGLSDAQANSEGQYWFDLYDQLKGLAEQENWQFNSEQPLLAQLPPEGQFRVLSVVSQFDSEVQQQMVAMMRRADGLHSVDVQLGQPRHGLAPVNGDSNSLNFSQAVERLISNALVPARPEHHNPELLQPVKPHTLMTSNLVSQAANFTITPDATQLFSAAQPSVQSHTQATAMTEWAPVKVDENKQAWGQQMLAVLKDRVQMQMNQDISQARIRLDPPNLGSLELAVKVENNKVHVQLFASDPTLREAITQQAERLRLDLESKQLAGTSVDVDVSDHQSHSESEAMVIAQEEVTQSDWQESTLKSSGHDDHRITRLI